MDILDIRDFCLSLPDTDEATPFDESTLVFRVAGKMFVLTDTVKLGWINLKCDPDRAIELRDRYLEVAPGFHMNKKHWNTVCTAGDLPEKFIRQMIVHSYCMVVRALPRVIRERLTQAADFPSDEIL